MIKITTFSKGTSYHATAKNINDKMIELKITADDIIEIEYRENLIFYKVEDEDTSAR